MWIGGVVCDGGLLAANLASLSVALVASVPKCALMLWRVKEALCYNSYHIIVL